jgi:hypothetical protein
MSTHTQNQLGAETNGPFTSDPNTNKNAVDANRSGTSTPGYAEEDGKLLESLPPGVENRKHKLIEELEYGVLMVELDSGRRKTQGGGGSSGLVSIESSCHFRVSQAPCSRILLIRSLCVVLVTEPVRRQRRGWSFQREQPLPRTRSTRIIRLVMSP